MSKPRYGMKIKITIHEETSPNHNTLKEKPVAIKAAELTPNYVTYGGNIKDFARKAGAEAELMLKQLQGTLQ